MKIKATKREINECFKSALNRVLNEKEGDDNLVGIDPSSEPEGYSTHDENFGEVNTGNMPDVDSANQGEGEEISDEELNRLMGEKNLNSDMDEDEGEKVFTVSLNDSNEDDGPLIDELDSEFGVHEINQYTGEISYILDGNQAYDFRIFCEDNGIEITSEEDYNPELNESIMPCEPFRVTTTGKVYWMRESKAVENVDTYKFRLSESYRKQCWKNYNDGKFVM